MKKLTLTATKVLKLSFVMLTLASAPVFAGGDNNAKVKTNETEAYAQALTEMAEVLEEHEEIHNIYTPTAQIKIYDSNYHLVREAEVSVDGNIQDEALLLLMRQSNEFMKFENITYYILND